MLAPVFPLLDHRTDHLSGLENVYTFYRFRLTAGKAVSVVATHWSGTAAQSDDCKSRHLRVQHNLDSAYTRTGSIDPMRLLYAVVVDHTSGTGLQRQTQSVKTLARLPGAYIDSRVSPLSGRLPATILGGSHEIYRSFARVQINE
jgi:hypothetical protein